MFKTFRSNLIPPFAGDEAPPHLLEIPEAVDGREAGDVREEHGPTFHVQLMPVCAFMQKG